MEDEPIIDEKTWTTPTVSNVQGLRTALPLLASRWSRCYASALRPICPDLM